MVETYFFPRRSVDLESTRNMSDSFLFLRNSLMETPRLCVCQAAGLTLMYCSMLILNELKNLFGRRRRRELRFTDAHPPLLLLTTPAAARLLLTTLPSKMSGDARSAASMLLKFTDSPLK